MKKNKNISDSIDDAPELANRGGGSFFTDQAYSHHGDITAIKVEADIYVLALQLKYGTVWADRHGKSGSGGETIHFGLGEYLTGIQGILDSVKIC